MIVEEIVQVSRALLLLHLFASLDVADASRLPSFIELGCPFTIIEAFFPFLGKSKLSWGISGRKEESSKAARPG